MEEYFILPPVSAQVLIELGVDVPAHLRDGDVSPRLCVLGMGFSWALYFLPADGGVLRPQSWSASWSHAVRSADCSVLS